MEFLFSTTSRAAIMSVADNERITVAAIPAVLEGSDSPVCEQAVALRKAATSFVTNAAHIVATFTPQARVNQMRDLAIRALAVPTQRLIAAGQAEARAKAAAWARLVAVPPGDATTVILRQQDRAVFGALEIGDKATWIGRANLEQLGAVIEGGSDRANVTPEIWVYAENRYAALNFIRLAGTAADHARQPTLDDPLAIGVDMVAAELAASEGLDRHHQRSDIIEAIEQTVQGVTNVVAFTCEMDLRAAFILLTTGKVSER
jgi:hypothetical protein